MRQICPQMEKLGFLEIWKMNWGSAKATNHCGTFICTCLLPYFKRYAHAAGPFNYSISRGPVLVSAGQAHRTARRARSCGNTFQLPSCTYPRPGRPAHMHGGIRTSVQSQPATEAQGHRHSQRPSRTALVHNASAPLRRWKE